MMGKDLEIEEKYVDHTLNIALDTIDIGKQAIVFVNSRRGAESQAEKIAAKVKEVELKDLSDKILNTLPKPTKQCKRLASCVLRGIAFHHSGLHPTQRDLIEESFKARIIKIICATPTLAMGVDMPAYRVVLRDLKRYGQRGMQWIPVLEYEQMSGRCGRPGYDDHGEAICVAKEEGEKENVWERYVEGAPEILTSKLAVEPVLRIYVLSLVATEFCKNKKQLYSFFEKTFYAHQYADSYELRVIIDKMVELLRDWEFIKGKANDDFVSASDLEEEQELEATILGKRISELYLDPYTANYMVTCMRRANKPHKELAWMQMISGCLEMRPLLRVKQSEYEKIREEILPHLDELFENEPSEFDYEYDRFLNSVKTALFFDEWIEEKDEDYLLEKFDIRPGEVKVKLDKADWLLYGASEIANLQQFKPLLKEIAKVRQRLKYGAKEELLALLKLKNVGRIRARQLYKNGIKDLGDVKKEDVGKLVQILGRKLAIDVKRQVGIDLDKAKVPERKRKGQINLNDYSK